MIDVRVGEHHGMHGRRVHRQRTPVAPPQLFEALKLATIDKKAIIIDLEQVLGTGHSPRRAQERQRSHSRSLLESLNMTCAAFAFTLLLTGTFASFASAQTRTLTLDDLYNPARRIDFSGGAPAGLVWISDTHYIWPRPAEEGHVEWVRVEAATGATQALFDAQKMRAALDLLPGLRAEDVAKLPNTRELEMNASKTAALVSIADDLYYVPFNGDRAFRLTFDPFPEEEFSFSPDGRQAAFVRKNNLYVVNLEQQRQERQLTTSGHDQLLNGKLDWVYQEEIYGRGNFRGYWWSPDSSHIAFLQLDERPVREFVVVDHIPTHQTVETWDYPKAGDPNPLG
jgi:dipeptidyl-peptidase-4